jgi:hypothetical protein
MQLKLTPYTLRGALHSINEKLVTAEASTLGLRPGHVWQQLYDDACDVGIALYNPQTGSTTTWHLCESETVVRDGDLMWWVLRPTTETVWQVPKLAGYTLKIFND